jgi:two-component system cell cycle response regulator DivK
MRRPLVLLADDFDDASTMYAEYLRFHDFDVITAPDGQAAITAALAHHPDIILLDIRMPVMTGIEALRVLRADPQFATVPVVALTAHAFARERDEALRAGFDEYLAKPLLPGDLVDHLRRMLGADKR